MACFLTIFLKDPHLNKLIITVREVMQFVQIYIEPLHYGISFTGGLIVFNFGLRKVPKSILTWILLIFLLLSV